MSETLIQVAAMVAVAALIVVYAYIKRGPITEAWGLLVGSWKLLIVGALFIACGLFVAYWGVQLIQWFFAFWPPLAVVLSWLTWALVGFIIPGIMAAEVCDDGHR